jgi:hypothetical protein
MRLAERARQRLGRVRHQDQMHMVGHQAVAPDLDAGLGAALGQKVAVEREVGRLEEHRLAPVAALGDVVGKAWNDNAADTRHARMESRRG